MSTLAQFRSRLLNKLGAHTGDSFYTNARMDEAINLALQQIAVEKDWPWLATTASVAITLSTTSYALPADFMRTDNLNRPATGNQLDRRSKKELNRIIVSGEPLLYSVYGSNLIVKPIPDGSYTLSHDYYRIETTLSGASDTPLIPTPYDEGVVEYAAYLLYRGRREQDKSAEAFQAYRDWLTRTEDILKQTREPLRITVRPGSEF